MTSGLVTSTGTFVTSTGNFGGCTIVADGTNEVTVQVRETDASGEIIFHHKVKNSQYCPGSFRGNGSVTTFYYSVSGTGGEAMFFEAAR
jgi:hypothetical protein